MTKLWARHEQVSLKPMHKVYVWTVTLTFDQATWFLFTAHCLDMIIIDAKLFINPTLHNKVLGWAQTCFTETYAQNLRAD